MDTIVLDIETKEAFSDFEDRDPLKLSVSLVGAYSYKRGQFKTFLESELEMFWPWLEGASLIVGFNSDAFDIPILSKYWPKITKIYSLDLLKEIKKKVGFRVRLDSLARATLGEMKSGDGLMAIQLFKEGRIEDLRQYCLDDVRLTRDIYEFGKQEGRILIAGLPDIIEVEVDFNPIISMDDASSLSLGF